MKHLPGALKTFGYCYHLHEDVFIGYSNETLTSVVRSHSSLNDIIINNKRFFENKPLVFFFSSSILSRSWCVRSIDNASCSDRTKNIYSDLDFNDSTNLLSATAYGYLMLNRSFEHSNFSLRLQRHCPIELVTSKIWSSIITFSGVIHDLHCLVHVQYQEPIK